MFKVGDRVRLNKTTTTRLMGYEYTIKEIKERRGDLFYREHVGVSDGEMKRDIELVAEAKGKRGHPAKVKVYKPKFALQFELDADPTEYFDTLGHAKKKIRELAERKDLKRDRIFLHTISKTLKVELGTSIKLIK